MTTAGSMPSSPAKPQVDELIVPVDLSHDSWKVLPFVRALADRTGAVTRPLFIDVSTLSEHVVLDHSIRLRAEVGGDAVTVEVLPGSDAAIAIAARANERPGTVVVMATHGLGGFAARTWGSICDDLLRNQDRAVFMIGPNFDPQRHSDIRRVVVFIDAEDPDYAIMCDAMTWAELLEVPIDVVTIGGTTASRPAGGATDNALNPIFDVLALGRVPYVVETLDDVDVATAIVSAVDRRAGTLVAIAPGSARRGISTLTHDVVMQVARECRNPMLLRWHRQTSTPVVVPTPRQPAAETPTIDLVHATSCHDEYDAAPETHREARQVPGSACHDSYDTASS